MGTAGLAVGYYYSAPLVGLAGALGVAKNAYDWATTYTVKASIRSIEVIDAIAVASDAKRIEGPHWAFNDDGDNLDPLHKERVARKPAVFAHSAGPFKVKIVLDVVQADYGKTYSTKWGSTGVLEGRLGALRIRCTQCPTGPGRHEVVATIVDPESGVRHYKGDVEWHLETLSGRVLVDKTFWEVFYTIAPPVKGTYENDWHPRAKYVQYAKMQGVWVEVLRLLCASGGADLVGESEPRLILQAITRYCHSEHGMTYSSSARYGAQFDGFEFDLMGYLEGTPHCFPKKNAEWQANCGDQSAAVMAFAHAVGIDVKWRSCHGFGYIRKTNLMGEDDCNNVDRHGESLVNALYENRLGFDNHCFIEYQGRIYDACIGPHLGTQSLENYLIAAIDTTPQCYPYLDRNYPLDAPPPKPGRLPWYATVKDVETSDYKGIFLAQTYESFQGF